MKKYIILIAIFILVALFFVVKNYSPMESFKQATEKASKATSAYVPVGYQVIKQGEKETIKDKEVFVTQFANSSNTITIYQRASGSFTCEKTKVTIGGKELCLNIIDSKNGKYEDYMWDTSVARYELGTSAGKLSVDELSKIVISLP